MDGILLYLIMMILIIVGWYWADTKNVAGVIWIIYLTLYLLVGYYKTL